jgi:hypothetical protein
MRNLSAYLSILLLVFFLLGCASTRSVHYDNTVRPAKPADKIEIYDSSGIHRPYKVIGTVVASTGPFHHVMDAFEHLQAEAAKMGADALIDLTHGLPRGEPMPTGGWFIFGGSGDIWSAKAIVWE